MIYPDYGGAVEGRGHSHAVRSVVLPFYKELHLPLPPFGGVHRAIEAFRPDVVHIATEATLGLSVLRFALQAPVSRSCRASTPISTSTAAITGSAGPRRDRALPAMVPQPDAGDVRPVAGDDRQLEDCGFERLVLWPRGVDATTVPARPSRPAGGPPGTGLVARRRRSIGYVSRIAPEKNVDYLADALAIVAARRPDARILLVGDGPSRAALERRIGGAPGSSAIETGEDLADHYAAADIFAFSSLTETFGNVVLEAMASGLPVVALRAGGVGETVRPGETGHPRRTVRAPRPPGRRPAVPGRAARTSGGGWPGRPGSTPRARAGTPSWAACGVDTCPSSSERAVHLRNRPTEGSSAAGRPSTAADRSPARETADTCSDRNARSPEERWVAREDQLGRPARRVAMISAMRGRISGMVAPGLVAEQVVHEEVAAWGCPASHRSTAGSASPRRRGADRPRSPPAARCRGPAPAGRPIARRPCTGSSTPGRNAQVVPSLEEPTVRPRWPATSVAAAVADRASVAPSRTPPAARRSHRRARPRPRSPPRRPAGDNSAASRGRAGRPGARRRASSRRPGVAGHRSRRRRARYQGRHRGQPDRPAPGPPPDQVVGRAEWPGQLSLGIGVSGEPAERRRRGVRLGQRVGRQRPRLKDDVLVRGRPRTAGRDDRRRDRHDRRRPPGRMPGCRGSPAATRRDRVRSSDQARASSAGTKTSACASATCLTRAAAPRHTPAAKSHRRSSRSQARINIASESVANRLMKCSMFDPLPNRNGSVLRRRYRPAARQAATGPPSRRAIHQTAAIVASTNGIGMIRIASSL